MALVGISIFIVYRQVTKKEASVSTISTTASKLLRENYNLVKEKYKPLILLIMSEHGLSLFSCSLNSEVQKLEKKRKHESLYYSVPLS